MGAFFAIRVFLELYGKRVAANCDLCGVALVFFIEIWYTILPVYICVIHCAKLEKR